MNKYEPYCSSQQLHNVHNQDRLGLKLFGIEKLSFPSMICFRMEPQGSSTATCSSNPLVKVINMIADVTKA